MPPPVSAKEVAAVQRNAAGVDKCDPVQVVLRPRGQSARFGGITPGAANVWRGDVARMSAAAPVKHAAGVSYRLDIHDHCRQCQSVYGHVERGLESESLCSVSGDGFLGEITFHSFPAARCTVVVWMCNL